MVLDVLKVLVAQASSVGALHAGVTTEDLMLLANAIAVATDDDPTTASRLLRLALTGIRSENRDGAPSRPGRARAPTKK